MQTTINFIWDTVAVGLVISICCVWMWGLAYLAESQYKRFFAVYGIISVSILIVAMGHACDAQRIIEDEHRHPLIHSGAGLLTTLGSGRSFVGLVTLTAPPFCCIMVS